MTANTNTTTTVPAPAANIRWIPGIYARLEADLESRFLSDNLEDVCRSAADSGSLVFVAVAGSALPKRKSAVIRWRRDILAEVLQNPEAGNFLNAADDHELIDRITSGEMSFADADAAITAIVEATAAEREQARVKSKACMADTTRAAIQDSDPDTGRIQVPQFWVAREDGRTALFIRHATAKAFAREGGGRFLIGAFDPGNWEFNEGPGAI